MAGSAELGSQFAQDCRYAWRSFKGSPAFTVAAIVTIALGVGVNTGVFSVVNALAFAGLSASEPDELIAINQQVEGVGRGSSNGAQFSTADYEAYRDRSETLVGMLAYHRMSMATLEGDDSQFVVATPVSCNYFDVLELPLQIGGGLEPRHCDNPADATVAVITHDLWVDRFDRDPAVLEQRLRVNGNEFQVVGVASEGFAGIDIDRASLFVPIQAQGFLRPNRDYLRDDFYAWLNLVGRVAPGASEGRVEAELAVIANQLDLAQPGRNTRVSVARATALSSPDVRGPLLGASAIVMAAFGLVFLVACTNVANLMLARADTRMRETAIRLSLGATRARLVRQFTTEGVIIAAAGGMLGAVAAVWAFQGLVAAGLGALPDDIGTILRVEPQADLRVFAFGMLISVAAGVGFGLAPALAATRPDLRTTIERDSAGSGRKTRGRVQGVLVGVQVAFSMVLVVATALLLRGLYETQTIDPAFDHENLVVASVEMQSFGYDSAQAAVFQRQAIDGILGLPGVEDVAQSLLTPLDGRSRTVVYRLADTGDSAAVRSNNVSANFFDVTGIAIVRGRSFTETEVAAAQPSVVILTESTARSFWPDQEPIGQRMVLHPGFLDWSVEVVGIARDVEVSTVGETSTSYIYTPAILSTQPEMQLVIRTQLPPESLVDEITAVLQQVEPQLPGRVRPVADNFLLWERLSALAASLALGLGTLALTLASVGVFGVMTTVVGRRVREIGIRLALGARKADVLRLMLRKSMRPVVVGAGIGVLACFGVARLLAFFLFGIDAMDPYALGGASVVVLGAGFLASAVPARRAMSVDPMTTLRYE